jgi:hypothetical protein
MKKLALFFIAICLSLTGCCTGQSKEQNMDMQDKIELSVEAGEYWLGKMKVFIFSMNKTPQFAAWIEDENGNYISTITVTNRSAKRNWISSPKEGRPEALPVWNFKQQNNQSFSNLDTVTTATPKGSVEAAIDKKSLTDGNTYNVYLEINHSFDYNDYWTKANSGDNGQPSLIYQTQFIAGQSGHISLVPIGHGSVDGSDGNIVSGLESLTSALRIIKNAYIVVK